MYGIPSKIYKGSESKIHVVLAQIDRATVAVESLSNILADAPGKSSVQLEDYGRNATAIMRSFELNGIACETVFTRDNFDAAKTTVTEFILRLIAMIRNATEYYYHLVTELKHGAKRLRTRASTVIGSGTSIPSGTNLNRMIEGARIFNNLNLKGTIPDDLNKYLQSATKAARDLSDANFVTSLSNVVLSAKMGQDPSGARDQFENELRKRIAVSLSSPVSELARMDASGGHPANFSSDLYPGNCGLLVYMPKNNDGLAGFRCNIVTNPDYRNRQQLVKPLTAKQIEDIGRTTRVFCDFVISMRDDQTRINQISREINAMARAGNMRDVGKSISPFAKMVKSPAIMQARLALTICSRAITYCEASLNAYDTHLGQ